MIQKKIHRNQFLLLFVTNLIKKFTYYYSREYDTFNSIEYPTNFQKMQ